jgi:hypothetical protein
LRTKIKERYLIVSKIKLFNLNKIQLLLGFICLTYYPKRILSTRKIKIKEMAGRPIKTHYFSVYGSALLQVVSAAGSWRVGGDC